MRLFFIQFCYAIALFSSAFLLFWIQPLISKQLSPVLGGGPMVWNTLLFFFQTLLLIGYAFVLILSKAFNLRGILMVHGCIILLVIFFLPIYIDVLPDISSRNSPIPWMAKSVFLGIGIPFLFLSMTAPLLQIWYSSIISSNTKKDPYFFYAISNLGSFVAIFSFLFLIEPNISTSQQLEYWSLYLHITIWIILICGLIVFFLTDKTQYKKEKLLLPKKEISTPWKQRLTWMVLAFVPASLLHGVTFYITHDLLSLPIFWIIPLGIYLLTFVAAFTYAGKWIDKINYKLIITIVFIPLILIFWIDPAYSIALLGLHLLMFTVLSLVCHRLLYTKRPQVCDLGEFYLWIAIGGAIAGFFNVIFAPMFFSTILEYPLSIALAIYLLKNKNYTVSNTPTIKKSIYCFIALIASFSAYNFLTNNYLDILKIEADNHFLRFSLLLLITIIIVTIIYKLHKNSMSLAVLSILLYIIGSSTTLHSLFGLNELNEKNIIFMKRNFFGIIRVIDQTYNDLTIRSYYNGTSEHSRRPTLNPPSPYNGLKLDHMNFMIDDAYKRNLPVASMGMGPARYQCYAHEGQKIEYFEINPDVVEMAKDKDIFGYLHYCDGSYDINIGDARLEISKKKNSTYGAILSSLYLSNTVPFHLFTKEALDIYISKLADDGYLFFIVPDHFFDFSPLFFAYNKISKYKFYTLKNRNSSFFQTFLLKKSLDIKIHDDWTPIPFKKKIPVWTDDFYNIFDVLSAPKDIRMIRDKRRFDAF